jgi:hypothetical protein
MHAVHSLPSFFFDNPTPKPTDKLIITMSATVRMIILVFFVIPIEPLPLERALFEVVVARLVPAPAVFPPCDLVCFVGGIVY